MSTVVNDTKIPNNVDLSSDKRLQRALEAWQPNFLSWWNEMGPEGFQQDDVFLRTAISVTSDGWANFDYVKMPDYRWGIFLARLAILTNGAQWRFFTDAVEANVMDTSPFARWEVLAHESPPLDLLRLLHKSTFDPELVRAYALEHLAA